MMVVREEGRGACEGMMVVVCCCCSLSLSLTHHFSNGSGFELNSA